MQRIIALIVFLITLPITLVVGGLILVTSGSPVFFIQERCGLHKSTFRMYKLRTMTNGEVTFIGRVLRKTGIDELPQLLNIFLGQMNFVGPRPLTEQDIKRLNWDTKAHAERWDVKPGITGPAQLLTVCDAEASFRSDLHYVRNKSLRLDIKLIFRSLLVPFIGKTKAKKLIHTIK